MPKQTGEYEGQSPQLTTTFQQFILKGDIKKPNTLRPCEDILEANLKEHSALWLTRFLHPAL